MQRRQPPHMDDMDDYGPDDYDAGPDPGMGGPPGMGPPGGYPEGDFGGGPPRPGTSMFAFFGMTRKALSICAMLAVLALECAVAIQDVKLVPVAGVLAAKNEFRKRDTLDRAAKAAKGVTKSRASASVKESCGYFLDFDVPAVTAGKARSAIFHFSNAVAMCGLIFLEMPGPPQAAEILEAPRWALPPVGQIGLATVSVAQMWLGSSIANHFIGAISYISAYMLIVVGLLGLTMSVMFLGKLKAASPPPQPSAMPMDDAYGPGPGGMGGPGGDMMPPPY